MSLPRRVDSETLDHLPVEDPRARRSRRDLVRVHRAMGTRGIVARGWRSLFPELTSGGSRDGSRDGSHGVANGGSHGASGVPSPGNAMQVLELGAGDGTLLLGVARTLAPTWPPVNLTLLDRQDLVTERTRERYVALGWKITVEIADVFDWAAANEPGPTPDETTRPWDLITSALFVHHFEGESLDTLLGAVAARTDRFFACEPRRAIPALLGSHLIGAIGASAVTREDAVLSVHAGFRDRELSALWPGGAGARWRIDEGAVGPFSHRFAARRAAPA